MDLGFVNAVEMLPMPPLVRLTPEQIDGTACVWCRVKPREPIALGLRLSTDGGKLRSWHPIAHLRCAAEQAGRVHQLHLRTCARCTHRDYCPDERALHRLSTGQPT